MTAFDLQKKFDFLFTNVPVYQLRWKKVLSYKNADHPYHQSSKNILHSSQSQVYTHL